MDYVLSRSLHRVIGALGPKPQASDATDRDSCGAQLPHNGFPAESLVEGFAGQSLAKPSIQYTCAWDLRQVPNLNAMPVVGLMGMGLRQRRRSEVLVVFRPSYKTGHKRQKTFVLMNRVPILPSKFAQRAR
jgi:hypothetical protein